MSKPNSGHFKGTTGIRKSSDEIEREHDIISERTKGLDLRQHPTKSKQLSDKKKKKLLAKIERRTITKREYKQLEWNRRFTRRRNVGISTFWDQERERIINHQPTTRNWNGAQIKAILEGKRPKYKGKPIESHHAYSVVQYPHLANRGEVIYPATHMEHFAGWHGKNYKNSLPGRPIKKIKQF